MNRVNLLLGYMGTLKSTITRKSQLKHVSTSNKDYLSLKNFLFDGDAPVTTSADLLLNHRRNIEEVLMLNDNRSLVVNRSLVDYTFWNYTHGYTHTFTVDKCRIIEDALFKGHELNILLLKNESSIIMNSLLTDKNSTGRHFNDYHELQEKYVSLMKSTYGVDPIVITDSNLGTIVKETLTKLI